MFALQRAREAILGRTVAWERSHLNTSEVGFISYSCHIQPEPTMTALAEHLPVINRAELRNLPLEQSLIERRLRIAVCIPHTREADIQFGSLLKYSV